MAAIQASVILCVRNGALTLPEQLGALASQDYTGSWELVVVDNGSTDGTAAVLRQWEPRIPELRIVAAHDRPGLAHARNAGWRAARGEILAFCDADDVADRRWLRALIAGAARADLVGGRLEVERLNGELARHWRGIAEGRGSPPTALGYLPYAVGANFAVRRAAAAAVGGWDEQFTSCGDDLDLSWRIQRGGGSLAFCPDAVMHYRLRPDILGVMRQRYRYGQIEALLRRKFRDAIPPVAPRARLRSVGGLVLGSGQLLAGHCRRGAWLTSASHLAGQLSGSLRYRVLA